MRRLKLANALAAVGLLFGATGMTVQAQSQPPQNGQGPGGNAQGPNQPRPNPAATPKVGTTLLYAIGVLGVAGAVAIARRRRGSGE